MCILCTYVNVCQCECVMLAHALLVLALRSLLNKLATILSPVPELQLCVCVCSLPACLCLCDVSMECTTTTCLFVSPMSMQQVGECCCDGTDAAHTVLLLPYCNCCRHAMLWSAVMEGCGLSLLKLAAHTVLSMHRCNCYRHATLWSVVMEGSGLSLLKLAAHTVLWMHRCNCCRHATL